MSDWEELRSALQSIKAEWDKAEADIKAAEQANQKVSFPSIKELRYAGRRIVEAFGLIEADNINEALKRLQDAEFNCHRARHDAIDATTAKIALDMNVAAKKLGHEVLLNGFPKFSRMLDHLNKVRSKIRSSRENREDREAIYASIESAELPELVELYFEFQAAEPLMVAFAKRERRLRYISRLLIVVGLVIAAFGVVF